MSEEIPEDIMKVSQQIKEVGNLIFEVCKNWAEANQFPFNPRFFIAVFTRELATIVAAANDMGDEVNILEVVLLLLSEYKHQQDITPELHKKWEKDIEEMLKKWEGKDVH